VSRLEQKRPNIAFFLALSHFEAATALTHLLLPSIGERIPVRWLSVALLRVSLLTMLLDAQLDY
jgi:hypothetical protein